ncbi:hypothetical protein BM1_02143 [Bipolaris maydis]|nr:hypothetical protein BM1_02143 [Bipolaris maydis]
MKIAFVATLAGLYALINYTIGTFALYNVNISQPTRNEDSHHDTNPNCESGEAGLTCSRNSNNQL